MFNVQCPGCSAPYQVDERRVPQGGLRMRCPKCATSFVVEKPSANAQVQERNFEAQPPVRAGAVTKASNPLKATMIGVAGPALSPGNTSNGAKAANLPQPITRGDLPSVVSRNTAPTPAKPPAANATLPAIPVESRAARAQQDGSDLPSFTRPKPPPPARAVPTIESDLPAALGPRPKALERSAPLPSVANKKEITREPVPIESVSDDGWALPELTKEPPLVTPANLNPADSDLEFSPLPAYPSTRPASEARSIDVDLPLHRAPKSSKQAVSEDRDDLEIDLPSPFDAIGNFDSSGAATGFDVDLDLPSPAQNVGLPTIPRGELPSVHKGTLPAVMGAKAGLPATQSRRFGDVDLLPDLDTASNKIELIPDLEAPLGADARVGAVKGRVPLQAPAATGRVELPDLTDALPLDSIPPNADGDWTPSPRQSSSPPGGHSGLEFGELRLDTTASATDLRRGQPGGEATATIVRQSGGGTEFGEVTLDTGAAGDAVISTLDDGRSNRDKVTSVDLEFGGVPQEDIANAAAKRESIRASGRKDAVQTRAGAVPRAERRSMSRAVRFGIVGCLAAMVIGGASLSMVPDAGLFGISFISDQLRRSEYERLLAEQETMVDRALASDSYPIAMSALDNLEKVQSSYPRARGLRAYLGFLGYAVDLRFGSSSERSAKSKALVNQLVEKKGVSGLDLAMATCAAAEGNLARAHQKIDEIRRTEPKHVETFVVSAQIEMLDRRPGQSLVYWRAVEASEHSARSAYGSSTAELALGQIEAAEKSANAAISRQPKHVGARLLLARVNLDKRGNIKSAESLVEELLKYQSDASPSEQVATQALLGDLNLTRSRISVAEAAYARALSLDPRSSPALRGLGESLYRAGRYAEALARYEAAVQADPDDTTAAVGVAKTQLSLERVREAAALLSKLRAAHAQSYLVNYWSGTALEAMGNREEAEKAFSSAIELGANEPAIIDAYIALALLKNQQGRREEAQKLLDTAREKLPASPKISNAIGQLLLSEGRYEAAISDFRQALKLDPTDILAKFRLGVALRKSRGFEEAMASFDDVAKVDHEYPGLALERGLLFETSGRTEDALKSFEDALAKAPSDADLMLRVGCGKVAAGRPKEAETLLRKVLEQRPMSAETHHCLGRAQLLEGTNLALALRTLERAVELDPHRPEYHLYVGWAANEAGRISVAEQALKKALSLDQGLGDAYWQRGVLRYRQGAVKDAVVDLTKAIELRPSRNEAHAALAEAYYELGMELKALEQWRIAVSAQPDNASWHFSLGKLLQAASRDAEARGELEKALDIGTKQEPPPRWIWEAHRLLARSLGSQQSAIVHWQQFLRLAPLDNAYRDEAKQALIRLGQPSQDGK